MDAYGISYIVPFADYSVYAKGAAKWSVEQRQAVTKWLPQYPLWVFFLVCNAPNIATICNYAASKQYEGS